MTAPRWLAVAHHLPTRTRLRSPVLRRDAALGERFAESLAALDGVVDVTVRPYTGSALISHRPELSVDALVEVARRALDCTRVLAAGEPPPLDGDVPALSSIARQVVHAAREIDRDVRRASDGTIDLGTLATIGFVGAGALEIATTGRMPLPPWFNLAWWGFRTFVTTEQAVIRMETEPIAAVIATEDDEP